MLFILSCFPQAPFLSFLVHVGGLVLFEGISSDDWCLSTALILNCGSFVADKTIKLWKISERDKRPEGYNLKEEDGRYRDPTTVTTLRVSSSQSAHFSSPSPWLREELPHPIINFIFSAMPLGRNTDFGDISASLVH